MTERPTPEQARQAVKMAFELLAAQRHYTQAEVHRKLSYLGADFGNTTFNNILNDVAVRPATLLGAYDTMAELLYRELGQRLDAALHTAPYAAPEEWVPEVIPTTADKASSQPPTVQFRSEGRLTIPEKVAFMATAQREVVEFGLRLHSFTNYFLTRSAHEFRDHVEEMLARGVNLKLYLLDPDCNESRLYFEDRARAMPEEKDNMADVRRVIAQLKQIKQETDEQGFAGHITLYIYKHVPYCHFLIVDGELKSGKMLVSPYLYGVRRADCPVIGVDKHTHHKLFRLYYQSFQQQAADAKSFS